MAHNQAKRDATADEPTTATETPSSGDAPRATIIATESTDGVAADAYPNTLTIVGQGVPSSFEITVDGAITVTEAAEAAETTVVSGTTVEGTVETGTVEFRFAGDLTDVTFVDRQITGLSPTAAPNVHVDYAAPERSQS
ncbi:hypothetical protein [Halopiger djelfimassiliensis]|uniref:hypothetical protein n=1 Tax=Halopiger djelfimassiliensis TaxID=1293047 RepID=UPI0006781DF6|nr:hypothetical protein [Halopiger djelfimassiliensis]